jgi:hypothetical protein
LSTTSGDIEAFWSRLASAGAGQRRFVSLRIDDSGILNAHAALRSADRSPCLLFDMSFATDIGDVEFEVGGMRCARAASDLGQSLVLSLEDANRRDLFATLCADVIRYAASDPSPKAIQAVLTRLEAWRLFLRTIGGGMNRSEIIGLMGELRILHDLLSDGAHLLPSWCAPDNGLHDFAHLGHALEVKTTLGPGTRVVISGLDQLDDSGLAQLDLVHVRLYESPQGECVDNLIDSISAMLPDVGARQQFSNALLRRGLSPDDRRARSGLHVSLHEIIAYHVKEGIPRILRPDVPPAITDVSYRIELGQLASSAKPWTATKASFIGRGQ